MSGPPGPSPSGALHETAQEALGEPAVSLEAYAPLGGTGPECWVARGNGARRSVLVAEIGAAPSWWLLPQSEIKPGHGLLLLEHLDVVAGSSVVDVGCGPLALHAVFASGRGAGRVLAIDTNPVFLQTASELAQSRPAMTVVESDLLGGVPEGMFDLATFHPPMLPAGSSSLTGMTAAEFRYHCGGETGRETLDRGLAELAPRLASGGRVVIGQFEFLGVEREFGDVASTASVLDAVGLELAQAHHYRVPVTETISAFLPVLSGHFPDYPFEQEGGTTHHRFSVVVARKP